MSVDRELFADRLPTYLTRFIGRQSELAELGNLLRRRLVTICGVGGVGKTRLAIETAKRWRAVRSGSEVHWVPLAPISEPSSVATTVAAVVGLAQAADAPRALAQALATREALIVLDNCEHLAPACADLIAFLLQRCPRLAVLVTSRVALHVEGQQVFAVPPLAQAIELFAVRAAMVAPVYALTESNAAVIGAICERLDGLPLAIELAASWIGVLSPGDLLTRLDTNLEVLSASSAAVEDRHRNIQAVLDSTWHWLGEPDRTVMAALGVFVGGFTREAAEAVAGATLGSLASLAERSLIQRLPDSIGGTRYHVHELVRGYALEQLERAGERVAEDVRTRHFEWFLDLAERMHRAWNYQVDVAAIDPLVADQANLLAALNWAVDRKDAEGAQRLCHCMEVLGMYAGTVVGAGPLERALAIPSDQTSDSATRARAHALRLAGRSATEQRDFSRAEAHYVEALGLFETLGDHVETAASCRDLGLTLAQSGDSVAAMAVLERSLGICRANSDDQGIAWSLIHLGEASLLDGELDRAGNFLEEALPRFEQLGYPAGLSWVCRLIGEAKRLSGDHASAVRYFRRGLPYWTRLTVNCTYLLEGTAGVAAAVHRPQLAATLFGAAAAWRDLYGRPRWPAEEANHQMSITMAKRQLSPEEWSAVLSAGRRLTPEQAVALAAEVLDELEKALTTLPAGLTAREAEVLRLVAQGLGNTEIADRLVVSPRTVHAHLRSIFEKLGVTTRTAAAHEASRLNLG